MNKNKKLGFTLAEVLIVIGIIGVVAALTLPNLNHATGDKETVTRLQKAYSILNEANDRAVAIYGPISSWPKECREDMLVCWTNRIGEFLKITKSCNVYVGNDSDKYVSCDSLDIGDMPPTIIVQLSDGMTFAPDGYNNNCNGGQSYQDVQLEDLCMDNLFIDVDGPNKGKNQSGRDIFMFMVSDSLGIVPCYYDYDIESRVSACMSGKTMWECTWWVMEYGNLDYLKADQDGKCNDSNIILDGTTNTSCH